MGKERVEMIQVGKEGWKWEGESEDYKHFVWVKLCNRKKGKVLETCSISNLQKAKSNSNHHPSTLCRQST